jgi:outer membrane protein OmpA-like peptidoglycan-associated protein
MSSYRRRQMTTRIPMPKQLVLLLVLAAWGCSTAEIPSREVQIARLPQAEREVLQREAQLRPQPEKQKPVHSADQQAKFVAVKDERALSKEVLGRLKAKETARGWVVTLGGNLLFDAGKATLRKGAVASIAELASVLKRNPGQEIVIEGFTDSAGPEKANLALSHRRAQAVKQALARHDVVGARVHTRGYGESYPVASNNSEAGRRLNRRVEVVIAPHTGTQVSLRTQ